MKEKYGAELELITDRFKQKMNQIKSSMSDFASKAKKDFTTGIYIDTDREE